jgi:hypothetical protein
MSSLGIPKGSLRFRRLSLEGEAGADLVGSLVKVLGIEGGTEAESDTGAEEDVVSQSGNTTVVDLGLKWEKIARLVVIPNIETFHPETYETYLGEGRGVQAVLAGDLEADGVAGGGVPGSLSTGLDLSVDTVVVASGEERQVVAGSDGSGVLGNAVADSSGVLGDSSLVDVVATLSTDEESLVAENGVEVSGRAVQEVEEGTGVQVGLLEVEVELGTLGLLSGQVLGEDLSLEALGDVVVKLELGVESVGSGPRLGESKAWSGGVY